MEKLLLYISIICVFISCEFKKPAYKFSNFYGTEAENIVKAIEEEDINMIREEVVHKRVDVNFEDDKYEVSLLELSLANNKKEAFEELLRLGANPNIENRSCVSPLISAIRYNYDCDLFFVRKLLDNGADINPRFFDKCNNFTHDPICETILHYNNEEKMACGLEILKMLTTKLNNPNLLFQYNNADDYHENVIYNCLSSTKNMSALRYLIIDLKYKVPKEIFIDGTVLLNYHGYKGLKEILKYSEFDLEKSEYRRKAKNEILDYLNKQNASE